MKNYAVMEGSVAAVQTSLENTKLKEARKYHVLLTWVVQSGQSTEKEYRSSVYMGL